MTSVIKGWGSVMLRTQKDKIKVVDENEEHNIIFRTNEIEDASILLYRIYLLNI